MRFKWAIKKGAIMIQPTVMVPLRKMKGHLRQRRRPMRQAEIAQKLADMPKLIEAYREVPLTLRCTPLC